MRVDLGFTYNPNHLQLYGFYLLIRGVLKLKLWVNGVTGRDRGTPISGNDHVALHLGVSCWELKIDAFAPGRQNLRLAAFKWVFGLGFEFAKI